MKSKLFFVLACALVAMLVCLAACSTGAPDRVSVTESNDGEQIEVAAGGSLTITLESNASTGFQWSESAEIGDLDVLQQTDHQFVAPNDTGVVGAPGQEVWTFNALKEGTSTISMEYRRSWESAGEAAQTFSLTVIVK
jgi:inhibitor of cysteine peptidase